MCRRYAFAVVIREVLTFPGTKIRIGMSLCGACTFHVEARPLAHVSRNFGSNGKTNQTD